VRERNRKGKKVAASLSVAEGARPKGGDYVIQRIVKNSSDPIRLGGDRFILGQEIEKGTGVETRTGSHGTSSARSLHGFLTRILATKLGTRSWA